MNSTPKVSVIIPAYNAENFIHQAIESVRRQTYSDYEVIVVNDGSTDATGQILDKLAREWDLLTVIHQPNKGLAAARNKAISVMKGEYIALLDADDVWLPEKLVKCVSYLDLHPDIAIVYTPMDTMSVDGKPMQGHSKTCHSGWLTEKLFMSIFVHDPAAVFRKCVIEQCGGFEESLPVSVGHEFWLRVSTKFEFGLIDEPLAVRRWSELSVTRSNRLRGRLKKCGMLERFYFQQGGNEFLPKKKAMLRLAKVNYHVAKQYLAKRDFKNAAEYFIKAIKYKPTYLRVYAFAIPAFVGSIFMSFSKENR